MNNVEYRVLLDMHNKGPQTLLQFNRGDSLRTIIFVLTENGKPYRVTKDCSCLLSAVKPDGTELVSSCAIKDDGTITYYLSRNATAAVGTFDCQLTVTNAAGAVSAPVFSVCVREVVIHDIDLESTSVFDALVEAYNGCNDLTERVQDLENVAGTMNTVISAFRVGTLKGDRGEKGEKGEKGDPGAGAESVTAESIGALKKVTTKGSGRVYAVNSQGEQVMRNYSGYGLSGGTLLYRESNGDCQMQDPIDDYSIANKRYVDSKVAGISSQLQGSGCIEEVVVFSGVNMGDNVSIPVTLSDPTADYVIFDTSGRVVSYTGGSFSELTPNYNNNLYYYADWSIWVVDTDSGQFCIEPWGEYNGTTQVFIARADKCKTGIGSGITCFIEGTKVLLRDKDTGAVTEKNIEDVEAGDYLAFWSPVKGRLTQTRAIVPPVVGECDKYHRLSFSDGRTVDVFGNQFFWDVDKDELMDWKTLTPGESRVCTQNGDIVTFIRSEEMIPDAPVKHYTLMTFRGRYIAGGIQVGDKVELFYPRLTTPEYVGYWDALTDGDRKYFKRAWADGMGRRNWRFSEEYHTAMLPIRTEQVRLRKEIEEKQKYLNETDYLVIKLSEGLITEEEFAPVRVQRQDARDGINAAREALSALADTEPAVQEQVRTEIFSTLHKRYEGVFIGKTRAEIS